MRSTFIDCCGYAGDITDAKTRKDCHSAYFIIKGGNGTVKVQTADSAEGEFVDYKVLVENADEDTVKGVFCLLDGAKNYIKVVGADVAEVIYGDCEFDPKLITPTAKEAFLKYKLYAWEVSIDHTTIGYTEVEDVKVGDVLLAPTATGAGAITDTDELTKAGVVTEVNTNNIKVSFDGETEVVFERCKENDFVDKITEVQGAADIAENGTVTAESGTVFKAITVTVEEEVVEGE